MKHISSIDRGDVKLAYDRAVAHDVEDVADMLEAFAEYIDRLEKQRDELLAAFERFMDSHEECTDFDGFTAQIVSMADYHQAQDVVRGSWIRLPELDREITLPEGV